MRLLYIQLNQGGRIYDIQLNHRSTDTHLGLCGRAVFTPLTYGAGELWWTLSAHTVNICTQT